jgi:hypothetical protein
MSPDHAPKSSARAPLDPASLLFIIFRVFYLAADLPDW